MTHLNPVKFLQQVWMWFPPEPIREDNILLKAKNCIITPHISWASRESRSRLMDIAATNLGAFIDGNAVNVVNL